MNDDLFREPTPDSFILSDQQIDVWHVNVEQSKTRVQEFELTLSLDEQERAARFRRIKDRECFIVARGSLRILLSHYLEIEPQELRFVYGKEGKPALDMGLKKSVCFNVSHSKSLALFAVALDCEVGIDIEAIQTDFDVESIARRYFTSQECAMICAAPVDKRHEIFFTCWTLKEAYIKASGSGLSASLEQIEILPDAKQSRMSLAIALRWRKHLDGGRIGFRRSLATRRRLSLKPSTRKFVAGNGESSLESGSCSHFQGRTIFVSLP